MDVRNPAIDATLASLSAPAMSKHLKVLRVGKLIEQELDEQDATSGCLDSKLNVC